MKVNLFQQASREARQRAGKASRDALEMYNGTASSLWAKQAVKTPRTVRREVTLAAARNFYDGKGQPFLGARGRNPKRINRTGYRAPSTRLF